MESPVQCGCNAHAAPGFFLAIRKIIDFRLIVLYISVFTVLELMVTSHKYHSSASRAFVTRKRFSACWGNSPIPLENAACGIGLRIRSGCFNGSSCQRKKRCSMSITPTLYRTFHHRLLCLFSSSCRTSCSCSCSIFCSSSFRISCTIF